MTDKACTVCKEVKTFDLFPTRKAANGGRRYASACRKCANAASAKSVKKNPEAKAKAQAKWREKNLEYERQRRKAYRSANIEADAAYRKAYREANRERIREYHREYSKIWSAKNKHRYAAWSAKRRAAMKRATPPWANDGLIERWYFLAQFATSLGFDTYHVDHIVPIQGELVCGMHVQDNLRILPAFENQSKGAKFDVV